MAKSKSNGERLSDLFRDDAEARTKVDGETLIESRQGEIQAYRVADLHDDSEEARAEAIRKRRIVATARAAPSLHDDARRKPGEKKTGRRGSQGAFGGQRSHGMFDQPTGKSKRRSGKKSRNYSRFFSH